MLDDLAAAIDKRCTILHLGRGSQEVKSEIGAVIIPSPLVVRHRSFIGQFLWHFSSGLLQAPAWEPRHPLAQKEGARSSS